MSKEQSHNGESTDEKCPAPDSHVFKATKTNFELIQDIIRTNLLTNFHNDRKINVTSRVLKRKNVPPPWWRCFSTNRHHFFVQDIIEMNLLSEFHEDRTINVVSRVKNAPPQGSHVFQAKVTIFKLIQDILGTNHLSKFHEDRKINVASRVLTRINAPPPGSHVFQPTGIIFKLVEDIIGMNVLTKFHENRTINVASRGKNAPPLGSHVFQAKFLDDRKINVASRVKNAPTPGGHVFQPTGIIFELVQDIIGINLLTKFDEDWAINVVSRVLTRLYYRKNAPPLGSHVFQANVTIFALIQDIIETNYLSKFHEDRKINVASRVLTRFYFSNIRKNAPPPGDIIGINLLIKFHEDLAINVVSRVLSIHIWKNATPLGSHVFLANVTIFELIQDIIETNLLTKLYED
ncbi:hypothetical protein DPMN_149707 [Dreissena polymorpha]|uniref:Uncharacterized protein n=1 Tax=Dreissena polymorpha TaxID=45954 RepID=A0A9D4FGH4_DREPO|nr:hypothetical protein DPMN_149707 [Dreissena polymorpha]